MDEINKVNEFKGAELNSAKAVLAFEATKIAHGKNEAEKAFESSATVFGVPVIPKTIFPNLHNLNM